MITRSHLIDMLLSAGAGEHGLVYVSVPITSGKREVDLMDEYETRSVAELKTKQPKIWEEYVLRGNAEDALDATDRAQLRYERRLVVNPTMLTVSGWSQSDYLLLWREIIEKYANILVLSPNWEWSRGARFEAVVASGAVRDIEIVDDNGDQVTIDDMSQKMLSAKDIMRGRGWSEEDIDNYFPPLNEQLSQSPASETFEWLATERSYQLKKFGIDLDDKHTTESGIGPESWWQDQILMYFKRAGVLGLDNPLGRQALAKAVATSCGLLESVVRVYGQLPKAGVSSGNQ